MPNQRSQKQSSAASAKRFTWTPERTDRLLNWLDDHPDDRLKLFSDSVQDAREQGRNRAVGKTVKGPFYVQIAKDIFSQDEDPFVKEQASNSAQAKYAKIVENRIAT